MTATAAPTTEGRAHLDVLIVGAGISGIDMACRLTTACPDLSYAILEARADLGGTWDLFRYPGIRSDSDMYTLSFPFRPWRDPKAIASGATILDYVRSTARDYGVTERIRHGVHVERLVWDSTAHLWQVRATVTDADGSREETYAARFLYLATGYYSYAQGHVVDFPGQEDFAGEVVHPQFWPAGLDVTGKRVVVIGSGATAVTLVPALAEAGAERVTMVQRSPTYMVNLPGTDPVAKVAARVLPPGAAHRVMRAKNIAFNVGTYQLARRFPRAVRRLLTAGVARDLPQGYDVGTHFNPRYNPWDERLCVVPDGDLFRAVSRGDAEIVTDRVARFTPRGVLLESGREVGADVIVTATGLRIEVAGGIVPEVDGRPVEVTEHFVYKGLMLDGVPNLMWVTGYTNNSWTLRADLSAKYACKLLSHMGSGGWTSVTPRYDDPDRSGRPVIDFRAGYVQRAAAILPKQGAKAPWTVRQNYLADLAAYAVGKVDDGVLEFSRAPLPARALTGPGAAGPGAVGPGAAGPGAAGPDPGNPHGTPEGFRGPVGERRHGRETWGAGVGTGPG